jgi:hypothetical protein
VAGQLYAQLDIAPGRDCTVNVRNDLHNVVAEGPAEPAAFVEHQMWQAAIGLGN